MDFIPQIPRISISPPPPEDPQIEPYSPFPPLYIGCDDEDGFRPRHLTPPPTVTNFKRSHSPPVQDMAPKKGLESDRFHALLKASRERAACAASKRDLDLRKEIAVKTHKNKQVERRALFLNKIRAPPSPTATLTPNTPPDSPSIFHYTLPSPGLVSPLALFETLDECDRAPNTRVEQVDFRMTIEQNGEKPNEIHMPRPLALPSLDQISARLIPRPQHDNGNNHNVQQSSTRPSVGVGRLRLPLRVQPTFETNSLGQTALPQIQVLPPQSPLMHAPPDIKVTTMVVPRTRSSAPAQLTETNLHVLNARDQKAHNMLSTLKRRVSPSEYLSADLKGSSNNNEDTLKWRRRSAPADIMARVRRGFEHPVLQHPAGF